MSTAVPEETKDTSTAAVPAAEPAAAAPAPAGPPEVDFERILAGDEEYTKATNEALGAAAPPIETEAGDPARKPEAAEAAAKPAPPALDPDEVVETIVYRGEEVPVTRAQQKDLLSKGKHLETRLREVAPVLALIREIPELGSKLQTPEGRQEIADRIRSHHTGKAEPAAADDLDIKVDGYDPDDVKAYATVADKVLQARLEKLGIAPKQNGELEPKQDDARKAAIADREVKTRLTLSALRAVDDDFDENIKVLNAVVSEIERTASPAEFKEFWDTINDPDKLDPVTGKAVFLNFYADVKRGRENAAKELQPAPPKVPVITRRPPASSGRLGPGAATPPAAGTPTNLLTFASQSDFDSKFQEALSRG